MANVANMLRRLGWPVHLFSVLIDELLGLRALEVDGETILDGMRNNS